MFGNANPFLGGGLGPLDGSNVAALGVWGQMMKALAASNATSDPGAVQGSGYPVQVQSLDRVMRVAAALDEEVKLYDRLAKPRAFNLIEEYNKQLSYGDTPVPAVFLQGGNPFEQSPTLQRMRDEIKFCGVKRSVTHPMMLVTSANGDPVAFETGNGATALRRSIEIMTLYGNAAMDPAQFTGLQQQIIAGAPTNVHDAHGADATQELIDELCVRTRVDGFGRVNEIWANPRQRAKLLRTLIPSGRHDNTAGNTNVRLGQNGNAFVSSVGDVALEDSIFIDGQKSVSQVLADPAYNQANAGSNGRGYGAVADRPLKPTAGNPTRAANAASKFVTGDDGTYRYRFQACNSNGWSELSDAVNAVTVQVGDRVSCVLTPANGSATVLYYAVYRTGPGPGGLAGTEKFAFFFPAAASNAATTITDDDEFLPGTSQIFGIEMKPINISMPTLCPPVKIPYGTQTINYAWAQVTYLLLRLGLPLHNFLIKNVAA